MFTPYLAGSNEMCFVVCCLLRLQSFSANENSLFALDAYLPPNVFCLPNLTRYKGFYLKAE